MVKKSFLLRGSLILFVSHVLMRILDFAYRVAMGRMLVPYDYGLLNLAIPLQFMIVLVAVAGVAPSVAKFVSKHRARGDLEKVSEVVSSAMFYYSIIGLGIGFLFFLLARPIAIYLFHVEELVPILWMAALIIPVTIYLAIYSGTFQGFKKMHYMSYSFLISHILRLVLAIAFVSIGWRAFGAITGSMLGFMITVPLIIYLYRKLRVRYTKAVFKTFREIFYFSIPISITALATVLLATTDVFFIGAMLDPVKVGIYSAASPVARFPITFSVAVATTLLPLVSESHEKKDNKVKGHVDESIKMITVAIAPMVLLLFAFGGPIIVWLFGSDYAAAVQPLKTLTIGVAFMSYFVMSSGTFQGIGKPRIPMYVLLGAVLFNAGLNAYLIPLHGINGAAIATAISSAAAGFVSLGLVKALVK